MKVRDSPVPDKSIPSTPQSLDDDIQSMQHVVQQNSAVAYPFREESGMHYYRSSPSMYASPTSNQWQNDQYMNDSQLDTYRPRSNGQESRYGWPSDMELFHPQPYPNLYSYPRFGTGYDHISLSDKSPGDVYAHTNDMKASRTIPPAGEKVRNVNTPRTRRGKQAKTDKTKVPRLSAPLSILTKDMDVSLRDMGAWVARSAEERHKETEKRNGYITRPMNSFMLYRSAYADRTKQWCLQNNHQVVSSVSGESWPMEPSEIREQYNEYARVERDNHQKAHPGYKFSPSKTNSSVRKRKGTSCDSEEEGTEQDASDHDWVPSGTRRNTGRQAPKRLGRGDDYAEHFIDNARYDARFNQSAFHNSNPGRPLPGPVADIDSLDENSQYYAQTVRNSMQGPNHIEEVGLRRLPGSVGHLGAPSGLPGANHDDLFNMADGLRHEYPPNDSSLQLDPSLGGFESAYSNGMFTDQGFDEFNTEAMTQENKHDLNIGRPKVEDELWGPLNTAGDEAFQTWVNESNGQ